MGFTTFREDEDEDEDEEEEDEEEEEEEEFAPRGHHPGRHPQHPRRTSLTKRRRISFLAIY